MKIERHTDHEVVEMPIRHRRAIHLWCRTCRVLSPGKVRDMTPREMDDSHPMRLSSSRFD